MNNYSTVPAAEKRQNGEERHKMQRNIDNSGLVPTCECEQIHPDTVKMSRESMPEETTLYDLSDFFKILGDSTRMGILFAIDRAPMCVCDIAEVLGMTKSAVSHQLKQLRAADLVRYRKSGKNVYYELADEHVRDIIEKALEHIAE